MSQEREIEFKEIPNTYRIFTDKVTVLERKVLFEKTEELNYFDPFEDFFGGQVNTHILTLNDIIQNRNRTLEQTKPKVLFEKNLFLIRNKKEIKKRRSDILQHMHHVKTSQTSENSIIDITSFEGINFNRPCTNEEKIELRRQFDYYVYPEAIDEINCEIKEKDIDGADSVRLDYGLSYNGVSSDLFRNFTEHQTKRLPEDYENQVKKMVDNLFSKAITRRVLVEKTGYYTYKTFQRYDAYITNLRDKDESNYWELRKKYRESIDLRLNQERNEMTGDLHRLLNND